MVSQQIASRRNKILKELVFQVVLTLVVFAFYTYDRELRDFHFRIEPHDIWFFLNYLFAASMIGYVLLPRFLYQKRYLAFSIGLLLLIAVAMSIEEGIIEKIFFPNTRGAHFPGIFFNLVGIMPIIAILSGFKFAWDAFHKQHELEELQSLVKESELQFLKSQINPHFLFNNLNNLYAYSLEQSPKTPKIILELSSVLRYTLYDCSEEYVPLDKELEQLEHFVNLSKLQLEERGEVQCSIASFPSGYCIAPLILTVFIENAFKHSVSSQNDNIRIAITVSLHEQDKLHFSCENTYSSKSNTEHLSKGIGLENVKKRLELLYPHQHDLKLSVSDHLYRVELLVDLLPLEFAERKGAFAKTSTPEK